MHIGIIGGGLLGVSLAYYLSETEHQVTLLEQNSTLGGLSSSRMSTSGVNINNYYHAILPQDQTLIDLCDRLCLKDDLSFQKAEIGFIHNGISFPLNTIWDFLSFTPLPLRDRLRLLNTMVRIRRTRNWLSLDQISVEDWLLELGGEQVFKRIWTPLLEAQFDYVYDEVPATYIWSWLRSLLQAHTGNRLQVGYLRHGHSMVIESMAHVIEQRGGTILTNSRVREIEIREGRAQQLRTYDGMMEFDAIIAAMPTPAFSRLIPGADQVYRDQLSKSRYLGLICPTLVLTRPLSGYWMLRQTDPSSPFSSIVEIPHPTDPNLTVVYLPKSTAPENDWMGVPDEDIRDAWLIRLRQLFPDLKPSEIQEFIVNRSRYVDPVYSLNGMRDVLPVQTPYTGLYLANTSQVYPHLPTSDSTVRHAQLVARTVTKQSVTHQAVTVA